MDNLFMATKQTFKGLSPEGIPYANSAPIDFSKVGRKRRGRNSLKGATQPPPPNEIKFPDPATQYLDYLRFKKQGMPTKEAIIESKKAYRLKKCADGIFRRFRVNFGKKKKQKPIPTDERSGDFE